jgi:hypothetical protein
VEDFFFNKQDIRVLEAPIVGFRWVDIHLFLRLIVAGILTTTIYNIANRIYDAVYSRVSLLNDFSYKDLLIILIDFTLYRSL